MSGWIKLHRSIYTHWVFDDGDTLRLFIYLLSRANHKEKLAIVNGRSVVVERGQLIVGRKKLSAELGLSEKKIRTRLDMLKKGQVIETEGASSHTLVTLINYSLYQDVGQQKGQQKASDGASKRPAKGQQKATTKEGEECKEGEEERKETTASAGVFSVFEHWKSSMGKPKAKLIDKRKRIIRARMKEGYTVSDLKAAIDGCKSSSFHMGDNDQKKTYNDLELILRDGAKVESFSADSAKTTGDDWTNDPVFHGVRMS